MKLSCPVCSSKFTLEQATRELALLELVELASKFGRSWNLVSEYVDCFRPGNYSSVNLVKRIRLLRELTGVFERCEFEYDGKKYRTDHARLRQALTTVANLQKWGFKNHNYLKKVLTGDSERISIEGLTAKEETAREERRRTDDGRQRTEDVVPAPEVKERVGRVLQHMEMKAADKPAVDEAARRRELKAQAAALTGTI